MTECTHYIHVIGVRSREVATGGWREEEERNGKKLTDGYDIALREEGVVI